MNPEDQSATELQKAGERIQSQSGQYGGARPSALAWVLLFLQEDAKSYSFGELTNRWWETLRFCRDAGIPADEPRLTNLRTVKRSLPGRLAGPFDSIRPYPGPADREWLQMLQGFWLTMLKHYIAGGELSTGETELNFKVQKDRPGIAVTAPDDGAGFAYQLIHLLAELGPRVRQCRYCQRVCLAGRADKSFCSNACQAKQWKIDHPEKQLLKKGSQKRKRKGGKHGSKR